MPNKNNHKPNHKHIKKKSSKFLIYLAIFLLLALCLGAYIGVRFLISTFVQEARSSAYLRPTPTPTAYSLYTLPGANDISDDLAITFSDAKVIGTHRAIICADIISERNGGETYGFLVRNTTDNTGFELLAESDGSHIYAYIDQLKADSSYTVLAFEMIKENKRFAPASQEFSTPAAILTRSQVQDIMQKSIPEDVSTTTEEQRISAETDAYLQLAGFDVGDFGAYDFKTKAAILMLEYSYTSACSTCEWHRLTGTYTKELTPILQDILSISPVTSKSEVLSPFTISRYSLTPYARYTENGAQIGLDELVLDTLKQDLDVEATYNEYPFIVDSAEFQEKYAGLINGEWTPDDVEYTTLATLYGWDTLTSPLETALAAIAAKNKMFFADAEGEWLTSLPDHLEAPFTLFVPASNQADFTLLMPAAVAFSYMNDYYAEQYGINLPLSLESQTAPKAWSTYSNGYGQNEVKKFSALWHLSKQERVPVPGFCLSKYRVSIDFAPADDTILATDVYKFLYTYGARYGFYPDAEKPYHWIYLGKSIPDEALVAAPLPKPLEN